MLYPPLPLHPRRVADYDRNAASAWDVAFAPAPAKIGVGTVTDLRAAFCKITEMMRGEVKYLDADTHSRARDRLRLAYCGTVLPSKLPSLGFATYLWFYSTFSASFFHSRGLLFQCRSNLMVGFEQYDSVYDWTRQPRRQLKLTEMRVYDGLRLYSHNSRGDTCIPGSSKYKYRVRSRSADITETLLPSIRMHSFASDPPLHNHAIAQPSRLDRQAVVIERAIWERRPDSIRASVVFGARATWPC